MATTHVVGISDCKVATDSTDTVVTYALGSCVGLALFDPQTRVGGLLHVMLPESRLRSTSREFNPFMYADSGFYEFLKELTLRGARRDRIEARAAGGANMLRHSDLLDIGRRNADTILRLLATERVPLLGSSLGGSVGRSMALRLADGTVTVRLLGRGEEVL